MTKFDCDIFREAFAQLSLNGLTFELLVCYIITAPNMVKYGPYIALFSPNAVISGLYKARILPYLGTFIELGIKQD